MKVADSARFTFGSCGEKAIQSRLVEHEMLRWNHNRYHNKHSNNKLQILKRITGESRTGRHKSGRIKECLFHKREEKQKIKLNMK